MLCLKEIRLANSKTQDDVARYLKIARASYANIENGKRDPDTITILALADFFHTSIDALFGREPDSASFPKLSKAEEEMLAEYRLLSDENKKGIQKNIQFLLSTQSEEKDTTIA